MALNMAVPISGVGGISQMSPIRIDCWENIKMMVSPMGSESSGVSSLDSEDIKVGLEILITPTAQKRLQTSNGDLQIYYNGRNVLDLYSNLETNSTTWNFRYSHLPERNNISMFWANRSLYNRLGPNGLTPVYTISKCECCDFQFTSDCPNSYLSETSLILSSTTTSPMIFTTASSKGIERRALKPALSVVPTMQVSPGFKNQQHFRENKNCAEPINKQLSNQNKTKLNDMFSKNTLIFSNNNNCYYNKANKFNNVISSTKTTSDLSQLTSNLVSINLSNSTSYTPPLLNNDNNIVNSNDYNEIMSKNTKSSIPPNIFNNNSLTLNNANIPVSANTNFHDSNVFPNNIFPNNVHSVNPASNKYQSSSSNNLFSLFNSNNTNTSVNHAFSANNENNLNSYNPLNNNRNNFGNNLSTLNSQNYGRMYKYF